MSALNTFNNFNDFFQGLKSLCNNEGRKVDGGVNLSSVQLESRNQKLLNWFRDLDEKGLLEEFLDLHGEVNFHSVKSVNILEGCPHFRSEFRVEWV